MASEVEIAKNQVEISNLKNDIQKIDVSIEKIGEATSQISKLLAVHDSRLDSGEETDEEIKRDIKVLHQRITEGAKEVVTAIHQSEKAINDTASRQHAKMSEEITNLDNKVVKLEQYKWYVMGIIASIAGGMGLLGYLM
jgi:chromosome segregation ATPase|tara:strand:- start:8450 stop:8866 length:417 start_codon:yes stop_codon:yes gene_type:complete